MKDGWMGGSERRDREEGEKGWGSGVCKKEGRGSMGRRTGKQARGRTGGDEMVGEAVVD